MSVWHRAEKIIDFLDNCYFFPMIAGCYLLLGFRGLKLSGFPFDRIQSMWVFFGMVGAFCLIWMVFMKRRDRLRDLLAMILLPVELYHCAAYFWIWRGLIVGSLIAAVAIAALYGGFIFIQGCRLHKSMQSRRHHAVQDLHVVVAVCLLPMLLYSEIRLTVIGGVLQAHSAKDYYASLEESGKEAWNIENQDETLLLFQEDVWSTLTLQEKLDALQRVERMQWAYWGYPYEITVMATNEDDVIAASYNAADHQIGISVDWLMEEEDTWSVLEAICHECYHAYQDALVELYEQTPEELHTLYFFDPVPEYILETEEYADVSDFSSEWDAFDYEDQLLEMKADDYGQYFATTYLEYVDYLLGKTDTYDD